MADAPRLGAPEPLLGRAACFAWLPQSPSRPGPPQGVYLYPLARWPGKDEKRLEKVRFET